MEQIKAKNNAPAAGRSKEEVKKEEVKVEAPPVVIEEVKEPEVGDAIIRYNHYKKPFTITDGVLKWEDIDEEYCFSFAFTGDYKLLLRPEKVRDEYLECKDKAFIGLEINGIYIVEVAPDEVEEAKIERKVYRAPAPEEKKKTSASD